MSAIPRNNLPFTLGVLTFLSAHISIAGVIAPVLWSDLPDPREIAGILIRCLLFITLPILCMVYGARLAATRNRTRGVLLLVLGVVPTVGLFGLYTLLSFSYQKPRAWIFVVPIVFAVATVLVSLTGKKSELR